MIFLIKSVGFYRRILLFVPLISFILMSLHSHASTSTNLPVLELSDNGRLTLNAQGVALGTLLEKIHLKNKLVYDIHKKLIEKPIYVSFRSLPLEKAIKRILHGISYTCIFDSQGNVERIVIVSGIIRANISPYRKNSQGSGIPYEVGVEPNSEEIGTTKNTVRAEPKPPLEVLETLMGALSFEPPPEVLKALNDAVEFKPSPEIIESTEGIAEVRPSSQAEGQDLPNTRKSTGTENP